MEFLNDKKCQEYASAMVEKPPTEEPKCDDGWPDNQWPIWIIQLLNCVVEYTRKHRQSNKV